MSASSLTMPEAYTSNKFWVQINSVLEAYFTECSGLQIQTEVFEYKEGGLNTYSHKMPTRTTYNNITLKHGFSTSPLLWNWYRSTVNGKVKTENVTIMLFSSSGSVISLWNIENAYPVKWIGPTLNAKNNEAAIETVELAYSRFVTPLDALL
ncbi:MAG: phage tail protein [Chloroflexota bacterium]|nr:phage tail protein [Chloroflexota bacterium]